MIARPLFSKIDCGVITVVFRNKLGDAGKVAAGIAALLALAVPIVHARQVKKAHPEWYEETDAKEEEGEISDRVSNPAASSPARSGDEEEAAVDLTTE